MSGSGQYYGGQEKSKIYYERDGDAIVIQLRGMTNHEMRDFIVGMWLRFDDDDKRDHIRALQHYLEPGSTPPRVSTIIATAENLKIQH